MAVSINSNGNEVILFSWAGKIMIGKIYMATEIPSSDVSTNTVIGAMNVNDFYMIHNPCEIEFDIDKPASGSAQLQWKLKPYFYKNLLADSAISYSAFAFPKNATALSNIGGTTIHPEILTAYKELVG